jgi:DNA-binding transcriptional regulator YiaG
MSSLGNVLKAEIIRLARKELRKEVGPVRSHAAALRRDLAAIKRQLAAAQRQIRVLERKAPSAAPAAARSAAGKSTRFVAKGLRSLRKRLGLSAAELARIIGVSEQSVYNWEAKKAVPRQRQVEAIAALRGLGKRAVQTMLAEASD